MHTHVAAMACWWRKSIAPQKHAIATTAIDARDAAVGNRGRRKKKATTQVMLKASAGGGGKGMRVARDAREVAECFALATDEAKKSFGDDRLLVEKFVAAPRHVEIQLVADAHGNVACFPERECSVQRRNQKVVEEAPSPFVHQRPELRARMQAEAAQLATAVGYTSAGTVEMLVDATTADFYFLEMNTRLQVEHPVTEAVSDQDLVALMLRVADGQALPSELVGSVPPVGWAIESRIYAEDAASGFVPSTGSLTAYANPPSSIEFFHASDVRVDAAVEDGSEVGIFYDPYDLQGHYQRRGPSGRALCACVMRWTLMSWRAWCTTCPFVGMCAVMKRF